MALLPDEAVTVDFLSLGDPTVQGRALCQAGSRESILSFSPSATSEAEPISNRPEPATLPNGPGSIQAPGSLDAWMVRVIGVSRLPPATVTRDALPAGTGKGVHLPVANGAGRSGER